MIRTTLALCLAVFALPASAADRRLSVTDFERVQVEGPFIVRIRTGVPSAARVIGDQIALDQASVETTGGTLRVRRRMGGGTPQRPGSGPLTIELSTRTLRSVRLLGAGRVSVDRIAGGEVELVLIGDGRLEAPVVTVDRLRLGLAGGGQLIVGGRTEEVRAEVQGTGSLDGSALRAEQAAVTSSTIGSIVLGVTEAATVTASGIGDVRIVGTTNCTTRGTSAAQVVCTASDQRQRR